LLSVQVLLKNPDLVSDTWLNFASALWFFVTPQASISQPDLFLPAIDNFL
jgi:hypothetical protein